ncbi:hypothetical protein BOTBODRAFT_27476 [Botryobasidium botryosum FD-172 SS1]|uniref:Phenylalanine ammonia-lyase n=1 Tax=Botryobasidium botryosum (strain FD-172 SS1) TaxID=930990 RepID=A0A067MWR3_BOTB1|nr:hypothetical protein BOTBODRAFT_27476 [Botryobasidium botryosum FD-172 SS1]
MAPALTTEFAAGTHPVSFHATGALKAAARRSSLSSTSPPHPALLLQAFLKTQAELEAHKNGTPVTVDGSSLTIADVVAAARYGAPVVLNEAHEIRARVDKSQRAINQKLDEGQSVYGLSTGFGGSADTRTSEHLVLGKALLQHQHAGILPLQAVNPPILPLLDPTAATSMPESWVRAAILVRSNSLIRGHSGVRWKFIESLVSLLSADVIPVVPLRGSISASGDLSPLSYVAGTLYGNPSIRVFDGPRQFGARQMVPSTVGLANHGLEPVVFQPKEHLGLLNGTAFSAAVASLALNDALHLAMLSQVLTALGTEALLGTKASHDPFIHDIARPHNGQVEAAKNIWDLLSGSSFASHGEEEIKIEQDDGKLRQDRYPLRTSPQFIGPQLEDILSAYHAVTQECNSTTDNPLIDGETGSVHHGGNFQAMAVTNAMEKTRLSLFHFGKLLFAQSTELLNPAFNRGLPPSLAASEPSVNYHAKGVDIATAAYVSELGYLANPVSTHIQSAEMHNQAVNSLALISARQTITAVDVLTSLVSSYLYVLCQALDLRALQIAFEAELEEILGDKIVTHFGHLLQSVSDLDKLRLLILPSIVESFDTSTTMDAVPRLQSAIAAGTAPLVDFLVASAPDALVNIPEFRSDFAIRAAQRLEELRLEFLSGARGPNPASPYIGKAAPVYEFVRLTLGVKMHGLVNFNRFQDGFGEGTVGSSISTIYEAIRDGQMQSVIAGLFQ